MKFARLIYIIAMIMAGLTMLLFWILVFFDRLLDARPEAVMTLLRAGSRWVRSPCSA